MKRVCCTLVALFAFAAPGEPPDITAQEVINHLNQTIAWYQHVSALDQGGGALENVLLADNVHQSAKQVVRQAFAFARAQAAFLAGQTAGNREASAPEQARSLEQTAASANQRIQNIQKRLDDLNQQIAKAPRRNLNALIAQRDMLNANLALAKIAQSGIRNMLQFASGTERGSGLLGQITLLAASDSVPAALNDSTPPASSATANRNAPARAAIHPESAGIAALLGDTFQLLRERNQVDSLIGETKKLSAEIVELRAPVRAKIREMLQRSDAFANSVSDTTDPQQLAGERAQLEQMAAQLKALSGPVLPLTEQGLAVTATQGTLAQWRDNTSERLQTVLGYLAFRLGTLAAAVLIVLVVSEIVRRATFRYVRDTRRRRQFVLIRRFVVGVVTAFIVIFASVSGIGSFATIAGFVTAGLAVALQNVILSIVAYFFLIGRYGLRTGDRVTVSGITGQVIEVGLVRLYLMEIAGTGTDLHSTGRVAVFSNSVIFQPSALIKQAPGTDYVWHGISATFSPDTNLEEARQRVVAAVNSVYQKYKASIDAQHAAFERTANVQLPAPAPQSRTHFTDTGVEVVVRYPVEIQSVSETDEQMTNAVMEAIQKQPPLKLASGGYPRTLAST